MTVEDILDMLALMSGAALKRVFWLLLASLSCGLCTAEALRWTVHPIVFEGTNAHTLLYDVVFGKERFVAMDRSGDIYLAAANDLQVWSRSASVADVDLEAAIFADGIFGAVGQDTKAGSGVFLTSSDGTNWTRHRFEATSRLYDVAYGNGWLVVVGDNLVARSANGVDWMVQTNFARGRMAFRSIDFVKGEFLATFFGDRNLLPTLLRPLAGASPKRLAISRDGTDWEEHDLSLGEGYDEIVYGRKMYVSLGVDDCCGWAYYSRDGRQWQTADYPVQFIGDAVAYGNGVFAISGWGQGFLSSTNGILWEQFQVAAGRAFYGLTFARGRFVAVGSSTLKGQGVVAVSEFAGPVRSISNLRVNERAIEFEFNAEGETEWQVEASENLADWAVVLEVEGTPAGAAKVSVPREREGRQFLRLKERM